MANFEAPIVRLTIEPHPYADRLEIARALGYLSVVAKGEFQTGNLAVYIPENSGVRVSTRYMRESREGSGVLSPGARHRPLFGS